MEPTRRLSGTDSLMWNIEVDPVLRSPILAVAVLSRPPRWKDVVAVAERAVEVFPPLRQRVAGRTWVDAPGFVVTDHIRRIRLSRAGDLRAVLDLVEPTVTLAFDPARPPWDWTIVEGLHHGGAAVVLRLHHTLTDGVGGIGLAASLLFDTEPPPAPVPPVAGAGGRRVPRPADVARTAGSLARELMPAFGPLSPIMRGRGLRRALDTLDVPLEQLRSAARVAGGSVNDGFLAAVGGGLARYHEAHGVVAPALRFTMPVSIRTEGDAAGGNRFAPARFVLPTAGAAPERVAEAARVAGAARGEPALQLTGFVSEMIDLLPPKFAAAVVGSMFKSVDVDAVDVPGLRGPARLAGAVVDRLYAFAPPTGAAVSVTLLSHGSTACIGIEADRAAVDDPALLTRCVADGLDEVLALAPLLATVTA